MITAEIHQKLEKFISKYYTNALLKGTFLFLAIGLLYFIAIIFIEHFLWLDTSGRRILFWVFILVELGLLIKFIIIPLARLLRLRKGLAYSDASKMIGAHFPEVSDKLLNL
ncbi:MAG: hypothetical protein RQ756_06585, partial [Flavobacteriaceae bacterium]|nr:hypothetical protein [Flavobacteriaceae bacterium]